MLKFVFLGVILAVMGGLAIYTLIVNNKIRKNGIETDAVVSNIKEEESTDADTLATTVSYKYYVTYQTQDGQTVEALINKVPNNTGIGERVKIKYLPEKTNYVLYVK